MSKILEKIVSNKFIII